jgi:SAM-dependent methyltransferase
VTDDARERTARHWEQSHAADSPADVFLEHPLIQLYISLRAFGSTRPHLAVVIDEIRQRTAHGARILSIGCGGAHKELALCRALPDRTIVGIDIAAQALARAQATAQAAGLTNLHTEVGDFNALALAPASFDMVLGLGALHHVEQLEALWEQCRRALRPGGCLVAQEYVGPARFQWSDAVLAHANRALEQLVPPRHRVHDRAVQRVDLARLVAADPSEAVRSDEILPTCRAAGWTILEYRGGGCGLLQPLLTDRIHAFDPLDWDANLVLFELFAEEQRLLEAGEVGDTYAMLIASP